MIVNNLKEVDEALEKEGFYWNLNALVEKAEEWAMANGLYDENFRYEDHDSETYFDLVKHAVNEFDEDGEFIQQLEEPVYTISRITLKSDDKIIY